MLRRFGVLCVCGLASSCANNPDVTIQYYLARTDVTVTAVRAVTCDSEDQMFVVSAGMATPIHYADLKEGLKSINITKLDSPGINTDLTFEFFDDGRLKGANVTGTGQGETILKSAIQIAAAAFVGGADGETAKFPEECDYINGGKVTDGKKVRDKALSLTFEGKANLTPGAMEPLPPRPESSPHFNKLRDAIGDVFVKTGDVNEQAQAISRNNEADEDVLLPMRQPAQVELVVEAEKNGSSFGEVTLWEGSVPVGQEGKDYEIPISKAALFGKQGFELVVASSGTVTKIGYGKETGIGQTLAVGSALADELKGKTTAEKAAAVQAEADLIAQMQRLLKCEAKPEDCT